MRIRTFIQSNVKIFLLLLFLIATTGNTYALDIPEGLEAFLGEDDTVWERVNQPGFGDQGNVGIVALCPYGDNLYAITRNDTTGFEIWKTSGTGWIQVNVPGLTDDNNYYGWLKPGVPEILAPYDTKFNLKQNTWCDMIEFNDSLYVAVTTGYQGAQLYGSITFEIWSFDGSNWSAVVSSVNSDETGTITGIASCDDTIDYTAEITDSGKNWTTDWAGCVLRVEGEFDGSEGTDAGTPGLRIFDIISNTTNTLTVQQNELAGIDEYTICGEHRLRLPADPGRPDSVIPAIGVDDAYTIECWDDTTPDVAGFGEMWNKTIVDFETLGSDLYATIGLNYQSGTRVWKTSNGTDWSPTSDYSYGLFHGYYPDAYPGNPGGNPVQALDPCVLTGLEDRNGSPVCSSSTNFGKSSVTGSETLFTGGTGSSGCNGRGARAVRLDGTDWTRIVDYFVDGNDTGTNENGFGDAGDFATSNFQAWSWAEYDDLLFVSVVRLKNGSRVMYTSTGSSIDGAWAYSVGGGASVSDGFGDVTNIGSHIYAFDSTLYAGTITNVGFNVGVSTNGADLWKGTGSGTSLTWSRVTGDGFGDESIVQFEAFNTFGGKLYVAASNIVASGFCGDELSGSSGSKIFRLASGPLDDYDEDGYTNVVDNCPLIPNGPNGGTCSAGTNVGDPCTIPGANETECGTGGYCSKNQEDVGDGDGVGDVCDNCPLISNITQEDTDEDDRGDACDNCPNQPNGSLLGTCAKQLGNIWKGTGVTCTNDLLDCNAGEACQMLQEDCNSNGAGDACECYADINDDGAGDTKVNVKDVMVLLGEYLREDCFSNPPCYADMNQDGKVNVKDVMIILEEYLQEGCPPKSSP